MSKNKEPYHMFAKLPLPKYKPHKRVKPPLVDILCPNPATGGYGHVGRQPNTNYAEQMYLYRNRLNDTKSHIFYSEQNLHDQQLYLLNVEKHDQAIMFSDNVNKKIQQKIDAYNASIADRREKLRKLLGDEEIEYYQETIKTCQEIQEKRYEQQKEQARREIEKCEEERKALAEEKFLQHFRRNTHDLREVIIHHNLLESKRGQLMQIEENRMKREYERELDNMWHELMLKQLRAMQEREKQDLYLRKKAMCDTVEVWNKQLAGREFMKEEEKRLALSDIERMSLFCNESDVKENERKREKAEKRRKLLEEQLKQIEIHQREMAERQQREMEIDKTLAKVYAENDARLYNKEAMLKEKALKKKEIKLYLKYLREFREARRKEDEEINAQIEEARKEIAKRREEAACALRAARLKRKNECIANWDEQLRYKEEMLQNELKIKQADNELMELCLKNNERLQKEHDRLLCEARRTYTNELLEQMKNDALKRAEERELLRVEYLDGLEDERKLEERIKEISSDYSKLGLRKHPFVCTIENMSCKCDPNDTTGKK